MKEVYNQIEQYIRGISQLNKPTKEEEERYRAALKRMLEGIDEERAKKYTKDFEKSLEDAKNRAYQKVQFASSQASNEALRKRKRRVRAVLGSAAGLATFGGVVSAVTNFLQNNSNTLESISIADNETQNADDYLLVKNDQEEQREVSTETETEMNGLTKEQIITNYDAFIDDSVLLMYMNEHGINVSPDLVAHMKFIANIDQLTTKEKKLLASSNYVSINDWFIFTNQLAEDMATATEVPFDAKDLFKDEQSINDLNTVMNYFVSLNNQYDETVKQEFQEFARNYVQNIDSKQNKAASELILNIFTQAFTLGTNYLVEDDVLDLETIFEGNGCLLASIRNDLESKLEIDPTLVEREVPGLFEKVTSTSDLMNDPIFSSILKDENMALQLRFVANSKDLTSKEIASFADNLNLEETTKNWETIYNALNDAVLNGQLYDPSLIFLDENKEDAANISKMYEIYNSYINAQTEEEKSKYLEEWNSFFYEYATQIEGRYDKNPAATEMICNFLVKVQEKNIGLTLDRSDIHPGEMDNGTKNLSKILIGDGTLKNCTTNYSTHIEDGEVVAERTFYEQAHDSVVSRITSYTIDDEIDKNNDSADSIYAQIVKEYGEEMVAEENNRYDVVIEEIKRRVKEANITFKENPTIEDFYQGRVLGGIGTIGGEDTRSTGGTTASSVVTPVNVQEDTTGNRDPNKPLMTDDEIKETEKKAEESKGKVVKEETEQLPKEEQSEEIIKEEVTQKPLTDEEKQDNATIGNKEDEEELNKNNEHFENGNNIDYTEEYIIDAAGNVWIDRGNGSYDFVCDVNGNSKPSVIPSEPVYEVFDNTKNYSYDGKFYGTSDGTLMFILDSDGTMLPIQEKDGKLYVQDDDGTYKALVDSNGNYITNPVIEEYQPSNENQTEAPSTDDPNNGQPETPSTGESETNAPETPGNGNNEQNNGNFVYDGEIYNDVDGNLYIENADGIFVQVYEQDGKLYIYDSNANLVPVVNSKGEHLTKPDINTPETPGTGESETNTPEAPSNGDNEQNNGNFVYDGEIYTDKDGNLYIVKADGIWVQVYEQDGKLYIYNENAELTLIVNSNGDCVTKVSQGPSSDSSTTNEETYIYDGNIQEMDGAYYILNSDNSMTQITEIDGKFYFDDGNGNLKAIVNSKGEDIEPVSTVYSEILKAYVLASEKEALEQEFLAMQQQSNVAAAQPMVASMETPQSETAATEAVTEAMQPETAATEVVTETVQTETNTPEVTMEAPQTEAPQTEAPQTEAPQTEAPKIEAPQTEAPQTEAPQTEAPQTEAPQTEAPQTEAPQTEAPQTEREQTKAALEELKKELETVKETESTKVLTK